MNVAETLLEHSLKAKTCARRVITVGKLVVMSTEGIKIRRECNYRTKSSALSRRRPSFCVREKLKKLVLKLSTTKQRGECNGTKGNDVHRVELPWHHSLGKEYNDPMGITKECELSTVNHSGNIEHLDIPWKVLREHSATVNSLRGQLSRRKLSRSLPRGSSTCNVPKTKLDRNKKYTRYRNMSEVCVISSRSATILREKCFRLKNEEVTVVSAVKNRPLCFPRDSPEGKKRSIYDIFTELKHSRQVLPRKIVDLPKFQREGVVPTVYRSGIFRGRQNIPQRASLKQDPGTLSGFNGQCPSGRKFPSLLRSSPVTDVQDTQPRNILSAKYHRGHTGIPEEHVSPSVISSEYFSGKLEERPTAELRTRTTEFANTNCPETSRLKELDERLRGGSSRTKTADETGSSGRNFYCKGLINDRDDRDGNYGNEQRESFVCSRHKERRNRRSAHFEMQDRRTTDQTRSLRFNEKCRYHEIPYDREEYSSGNDYGIYKTSQLSTASNSEDGTKRKRCEACKNIQNRAFEQTFPCEQDQMSEQQQSGRNLHSYSQQYCQFSCPHQTQGNHSSERKTSHGSSLRTRSPNSNSPSGHLSSVHPSLSAPPHRIEQSRMMSAYNSPSFNPPPCQLRSRSRSPNSRSSSQRMEMVNERSPSNEEDCCPCGVCGGANCFEKSMTNEENDSCCGAKKQPGSPCKCKCQTCKGVHPSGGCGGQSCGRIYSCAGSGGGSCSFPRNTKRRSGPECCSGGKRGCGGCC